MIPKKPNLISLITSILLGLAAATISLSAASAPLIGTSGIFNDLPFPGHTPGLPDRINPIYVDATRSFTGTWNTTAALEWQGTFSGTPARVVTSTNPVGINTMNFSALPNGVLPKNTFFGLGDLDNGTGSPEFISLRAWDLSNTLITTPWLDEPTFQDGTDNPQLASMLPEFKWDSVTGTYTFTGENVPNNPSTNVFMFNNTPILELEVNDQTPFAGFGIAAPPRTVSEPAIVWLIILGLTTLIFLKWQRA